MVHSLYLITMIGTLTVECFDSILGTLLGLSLWCFQVSNLVSRWAMILLSCASIISYYRSQASFPSKPWRSFWLYIFIRYIDRKHQLHKQRWCLWPLAECSLNWAQTRVHQNIHSHSRINDKFCCTMTTRASIGFLLALWSEATELPL